MKERKKKNCDRTFFVTLQCIIVSLPLPCWPRGVSGEELFLSHQPTSIGYVSSLLSYFLPSGLFIYRILSDVSLLQWGTVDAEGSPGLSNVLSLFKPGVGIWHCLTCYAYCQGLQSAHFWHLGSFCFIYSTISPNIHCKMSGTVKRCWFVIRLIVFRPV